MDDNNHQRRKEGFLPWVPLSSSAWFILRNSRLLGWSLLLVLITAALTWGGFLLTTDFIDQLTGSFIHTAPATESWWGWIKYSGWLAAKYLFLVVSRIVAFYLAFLAAYSLSAPLYVFLSTSAEKIFCGEKFEADEGFTIAGVCKDLWEGIKIGSFGIIVTVIALFVSFVPVLGQVAVFLLYACYSTLMFIDYPASRRRWSLGRKIGWLRENGSFAIRLGIIPAAASMIPLLNLILIALIFPLFTVHATLNFYVIEHNKKVLFKIPPSS
jgi:CysZ protein